MSKANQSVKNELKNSEISKTENMENSVNVNETLTPAVAPEVAPEVKPELIVVPEFMKPILAQREAEDAENVNILTKLNAVLKEAKKEYVKILTEADFEQTEATIAASGAVKIADEAIADFNKKLTLLSLDREANDSLNVARYDLADKFGVKLELIDKLLENSKDVKDTLKSSFTALFGRPVIHAKQGQTGKDLSKSMPKAGTEVNVSLNGNPEKVGSKRYEIYNDLLSGLTYADLLAKYPTDGNPEKLNGTARTVISDHKFKRTENNSYVIEA